MFKFVWGRVRSSANGMGPLAEFLHPGVAENTYSSSATGELTKAGTLLELGGTPYTILESHTLCYDMTHAKIGETKNVCFETTLASGRKCASGIP